MTTYIVLIVVLAMIAGSLLLAIEIDEWRARRAERRATPPPSTEKNSKPHGNVDVLDDRRKAKA